MLHLTRTVRFCLNDQPDAADESSDAAHLSHGKHNTYSAWPAMAGLGRYYEAHITCQGEADPVSGYFMNIRDIDKAFRNKALPFLQEQINRSPAQTPAMGWIMQQLLHKLDESLRNSLQTLELQLTPFHSLALEKARMDRVTLRQQFEFSAAHRLHVPDWGDQANRDYFGKCNNPAGHGHNYRLEVAVEAPIDSAGQTPPVNVLDRLVERYAIDPLDHKNLNVDVPEFKQLNPSVENISMVIWDFLWAPLAEQELTLAQVKVWETGKTSCTYAGPAPHSSAAPPPPAAVPAHA